MTRLGNFSFDIFQLQIFHMFLLIYCCMTSISSFSLTHVNYHKNLRNVKMKKLIDYPMALKDKRFIDKKESNSEAKRNHLSNFFGLFFIHDEIDEHFIYVLK
ncbi:hypothetical protein HPP92_014532 [Vanilla planifolia]|uniref:Uncharacterized protein n=1 Tax=Vanilla planifolia TaxID=51239 RepID=A0A835QK67_VANPL|nr:hypothetical protein HPP92_014532 [Vanilla planifolia]